MSSNKKTDEKMKAVSGKSLKNVKSLYSSSVNAIGGVKFQNPIKSVGLKLFLIIFSAILVCVLVVGLFSYSTSKSIIKKKVSESDTVAISQSQGKLDLMFGNYEALTMQILLDKTVQENLQKYQQTTDDYGKFDILKKLSDTIQTYILGNSSIVGAALIPLKGDGSSISVGGTSINSQEAQKTEWMKNIADGDGRIIWLPSQAKGYSGNSSEPTVALGRFKKYRYKPRRLYHFSRSVFEGNR